MGSREDRAIAEGTRCPAAEESTDTQPGSCIGTPRYMSPEQAAGDHDGLTPASDIYSLGATLYHLLAGEPPWGDESDLDVIREQARAGTLAPPSVQNRSVPRPLEAICLNAMSVLPGDRYPSAGALSEDIQ